MQVDRSDIVLILTHLLSLIEVVLSSQVGPGAKATKIFP
jgi:hypothetical protein